MALICIMTNKKNKLAVVEEIRIPFIIKYLSPQYGEKTWEELLEDPEVLMKNTFVCENWYLQITEFTLNQDAIHDELKEENKHDNFI